MTTLNEPNKAHNNTIETTKNDNKNIVLGIIIIALAFLTFSICDALIKSLNGKNSYKIIAVGYFPILVGLLIYQWNKDKSKLIPKSPKLTFFMGINQVLKLFILFYILHYIPLNQMYALAFLTPAITLILAIIFLNEKATFIGIVSVIIGFIGVLISLNLNLSNINLVFIIGLGLPITSAIVNITLRYLRNDEESSVLLITTPLFLFISATIVYLMGEPETFTTTEIIISLIIGATSIFAGYLLQVAMRYAPANKLAPIHYTQIIWGTLFSIMFFNEYPTINTYIGILIIIISGLLIMYDTKKNNQKA